MKAIKKHRFITTLFSAIGIFASSVAFSASVYTQSVGTPIDSIKTYASLGNGDIYLILKDTSHQECPNGYYIDKNSSGYDSILGVLLSAKMANQSIVVGAMTEKPWVGSSNVNCEIYMLHLE